jgi:hypothetical protein
VIKTEFIFSAFSFFSDFSLVFGGTFEFSWFCLADAERPTLDAPKVHVFMLAPITRLGEFTPTRT